jgi:pimeloyl-ACP methyl ester carboxylesterase
VHQVPGTRPRRDQRGEPRHLRAYDQPGAIRAANGWYQAPGQDIDDMQTYGKLDMPVLALGGLFYEATQHALADKATDIRFVELPGAGHYLSEERPDDVLRVLSEFFD